MSNLILVGNGPSVLRQRLGKVIDSFDVVVRFNRFVTKGFEEYVGSRTDFWFTVTNRSRRRVRRIKFKRTYWWHPQSRGFGRFNRAYPDAILIDPTILEEIGKVAEVTRSEYKRWSTGAIAAHTVLKEFPVVHIIGFDWWDGDDEGRHHYGDEQTRGESHQPDYELMFFGALFEAGVVVDLNNEKQFGASI